MAKAVSKGKLFTKKSEPKPTKEEPKEVKVEVKEPEVVKVTEVTPAELLNIVNGFEYEVGSLKYLRSKMDANVENRVLNKQYAAQLAVVKNYLENLNVKIK